MKLQGFGVEDPGSLQSQNCQRAKNRLSLNGLDFVHGQLASEIGSRALRTSGIGAALRRGLPKSKKPAFGKQKQALSFAATQRTGRAKHSA